MFYTFSSDSHQYIIEDESLQNANRKIHFLKKDEDKYNFIISSTEPCTIYSEIKTFIPATILYNNGKLEQIKGSIINVEIKVV